MGNFIEFLCGMSGLLIACLVFKIILCLFEPKDYYEVPKKQIKFYHPILRQAYYDLSDFEKRTNEVRHYLIKQNNHMNEFYPYVSMDDRLRQIEKNYAIQTIFNYIKFDIKKI
jgi:hypothetical protein